MIEGEVIFSFENGTERRFPFFNKVCGILSDRKRPYTFRMEIKKTSATEVEMKKFSLWLEKTVYRAISHNGRLL